MDHFIVFITFVTRIITITTTTIPGIKKFSHTIVYTSIIKSGVGVCMIDNEQKAAITTTSTIINQTQGNVNFSGDCICVTIDYLFILCCLFILIIVETLECDGYAPYGTNLTYYGRAADDGQSQLDVIIDTQGNVFCNCFYFNIQFLLLFFIVFFLDKIQKT